MPAPLPLALAELRGGPPDDAAAGAGRVEQSLCQGSAQRRCMPDARWFRSPLAVCTSPCLATCMQDGDMHFLVTRRVCQSRARFNMLMKVHAISHFKGSWCGVPLCTQVTSFEISLIPESFENVINNYSCYIDFNKYSMEHSIHMFNNFRARNGGCLTECCQPFYPKMIALCEPV